ncbi:MAG: hypothetical protein F8N39_11480 [Clostridiaceae bacterium]|nr:hypothetical protein [Clostridiaceae bacterium]
MGTMTFTVGDIFWKAGISDEGEAWVDEWHLRSIRKGRGYLSQRIEGLTFTKGKWESYVPAYCRKKFSIDPATGGRGLRSGFCKSRAAALADEIKRQTAYIAELQAEGTDAEYIAAQKKGLRTLKGFLTKDRNQTAKKKAANAAKRAAKPAAAEAVI